MVSSSRSWRPARVLADVLSVEATVRVVDVELLPVDLPAVLLTLDVVCADRTLDLPMSSGLSSLSSSSDSHGPSLKDGLSLALAKSCVLRVDWGSARPFI